jgi:ABC-type antimicrobial peptide transport system permease subunit
MALLLASVGLCGVMAYGFERRRREMGLRIALGAGQQAMARLVLGSGLKLAAWGIALGSIASYLLRGVVSGLLFAIEAGDPWTYLVVTGVIALTALAGSLGPMRRALRVDPATALRSD